jgi:hypothetical protein
MNVSILISIFIMLSLVLVFVFLTNKIKTKDFELKKLGEKLSIHISDGRTARVVEALPTFQLLTTSVTENTSAVQVLQKQVKELKADNLLLSNQGKQLSTTLLAVTSTSAKALTAVATLKTVVDDKMGQFHTDVKTIEQVIKAVNDKLVQLDAAINHLHVIREDHHERYDKYDDASYRIAGSGSGSSASASAGSGEVAKYDKSGRHDKHGKSDKRTEQGKGVQGKGVNDGKEGKEDISTISSLPPTTLPSLVSSKPVVDEAYTRANPFPYESSAFSFSHDVDLADRELEESLDVK